VDIEYQRPRRIGHFANVMAGAHATEKVLSEPVNNGCEGEKVWLEIDVCNPGLDGARREVVGLVRFANILPVIDHSSELDRGEVRGGREPVLRKQRSSQSNQRHLGRRNYRGDETDSSLRACAPSALLRTRP